MTAEPTGRAEIIPPRPGRDWFEFFRGAGRLVVVYAPPLAVAGAGVWLAVSRGWLAPLLVLAGLPVYWLLAAVYARLHPGPGIRPAAAPPVTRPRRSTPVLRVPAPPASEPHPHDPRAVTDFRRIGIVLAGGGAKGVYQAGAMLAIHRFLADRGLIDRVVAVAGTSIGSWNTMFWLAGLLDGGVGSSPLARWWTTTAPTRLVRPGQWILPGVSAHALSSDPWEREFDRWFADPPEPRARLERLLAGGPPHFYLTRTNVRESRLAFDTNNPAAVAGDSEVTHDLDEGRRPQSLPELRDGVLASMCLPPVFPYRRMPGRNASAICEDGGVLDNLPIRLPMAFGRCDLLFVLPLNATFADPSTPKVLPGRLSRVVDMRGGALERAALKAIYLFSVQNALKRNADETLPGPVCAFAIAPAHPLQVGTVELWKLRRWGRPVLEQMYAATTRSLEAFFAPDRLRRFFAAYHQFQKHPQGGLHPAGWQTMTVVPAHWDPIRNADEPFPEEWRF